MGSNIDILSTSGFIFFSLFYFINILILFIMIGVMRYISQKFVSFVDAHAYDSLGRGISKFKKWLKNNERFK